jgi:predicted phage terminase large subunit-like protein
MAEHLTRKRFQRFRHIQFLDRKLAQAVARGGARIVISMPPRHGKSWLTSLYTPAWYLSLWPDRSIILASYEATFAATWGRGVRNFLQENQGDLGVRLAEDSLSADRWNTTQGGGMVTAGIGGPITGRGGHLLIIDDPIKNWEEAASDLIREKQIEWFNSTLYTRAEPGASIIVLMTRWHERDLAGYLLTEHHDKWEEIKLPAIAEENDPLGRAVGDALCPERYSAEMLANIRSAVGPRVWNSLYQQRPAPLEGNLFKEEMFEYGPIPQEFDFTFIMGDTAYKDKQENDFTVFTAFGVKGESLFVIDVLRGRIQASDIEAPALAFINRLSSYGFRGAYIEPKGHGIYLNQALPRKGVLMPGESQLKEFYSDRHLNKVERANNAIPYLVNRKVRINEKISCKEELVAECLSFPRAKHDDFVDTLVDGVKFVYGQKICSLEALDQLVGVLGGNPFAGLRF